MSKCDALIIGSSPDALVAAAYLARAGKKTLVLEASSDLGEAVSTREFHPGFKADIGLMSGRIDPAIASDLKLNQHGLDVIERETITTLLPDGNSLTLHADPDLAAQAIGRLSGSDAEKYPKFIDLLNKASSFLRAAYQITPPKVHHPSATEQQQLFDLVAQLKSYGRRETTEIVRLLVMSVRDLLDEWFENIHLKGLLATAAVRALTQGPFAGGTTFCLLHHLAIGDGFFRATARGGTGALSLALADAARSNGVEIRLNTPVRRILVADGKATGVELSDGQAIEAVLIISSKDAAYTFTRLVDPPELEPEFNRSIRRIRYNGSVARVNLALKDLPSFKGITPDSLKGTLLLAPSIAYLERAFDRAKYGQVSNQPYLELTIPSLSDPSLAPKDHHVLSVWLQYAPYKGQPDTAVINELLMQALTPFVPNLQQLVIHSQVLTPAYFQDKLQLAEGHLYGSDMTLNQVLFQRPLPDFAQYRTPLENLFLCGASTHPGGGVSGLSGRNAVNHVSSRQLQTV